MKTCPTCRRTYADDDLNFCLDDGSVLQRLTASGAPETFLLNQTRSTDSGRPPDTVVSQFEPAPEGFTMQPKKSSRGGLWAIVILGLLVVLCGGGAVAVGVFVANLPDTNSVGPVNSRKDPEQPNKTGSEMEIDLSLWKIDDGSGLMSNINGENVMRSRKANYYYVLIARPEYATANAVTTVTVRNVEDKATNLGFGLVFHSGPTPLVNDHAFLVDTKRGRYRIVKHTPGKETHLVKWTRSPSIKGGTEENVLEVRDKDKQIEFYINGTKLTAIRNSDGATGVAGIYAGDAIPVAFKNFVIKK